MDYLYEEENIQKFNSVVEPTALTKVVDIHIEEPELSLFPDAQCKLVENLIFTATHSKDDRLVTLMLATHSPYILNYLNIMLNQTDEQRARLNNSNTAVYRIYEGETQDLLMQDDKGHWIVDTYDLSEMMSSIYNEFVRLGV